MKTRLYPCRKLCYTVVMIKIQGELVMKIGFDPDKYILEQSKYILERVNNYDKLYLEFGGKLISDLHAKRVLPGFDENAKIKLLQQLKDK